MVTQRDKIRFALSVSSLFLILYVLLFASGCLSITGAHVPDDFLVGGWQENILLRSRESQFFGLGQTVSVTYEISGKYPASLTIFTIKSLVLIEEQELSIKVLDTLNTTVPDGIALESKPKVSGDRIINTSRHWNQFFVFEGIDTRLDPSEQVYVIGEAWNCPDSGTSILCVGIAYVTHTVNDTVLRNETNWRTIVMDPRGAVEGIDGSTGLIDHVICH